MRRATARVIALALLGAVLTGCGGGTERAPGGPLQVVAAENFWGSIAAQLGGDHVRVASIIASPDIDPHDYEPTPADGRAVASADYVIANGFGYDAWMDRLAAASRSARRERASVQEILGLPDNANPHRWYAPSDVLKVVDRIAADYARLDPGHAADYERLKREFLGTGLQAYQALAQQIRDRYAGTPVGATESIAAPLASDLRLQLLTPERFLSAISEGGDPTAQDKATFDAQIARREIRVLLYNTQNATPDVQRQVEAARAAGIPVVSLTETPEPPAASFQEWQTRQLRQLADALAAATGK